MALAQLAEDANVGLTSALASAPDPDDGSDVAAVAQCHAALRLAAEGVSQRARVCAVAAHKLEQRILARDDVGMLATATDLQNKLRPLVALEHGGVGETIAAMLRDATP